jgi:L,D-transpeptidase YcbB
MRQSIITLCLSLVLLVCAADIAQAQTTNQAVNDSIATLLTNGRHPYLQKTDLGAERPVLQQLYQQRGFAPLWFEQGQITRPGLALLTLLRDAASYGLRASDYDGITLATRLTQLSTATDTQDAQAQLDIGLSTAALRLIRHLHYGRIDPRKVGFDIKTVRDQELDAAAVLTRLVTTTDPAPIIASVEPQFVHYQLLKRALARYRLLAVDAELTELPAFTGRSIKPGESYVGAPALRRLLLAEQDLPKDVVAEDSDATLDAALVTALQAYQTRHGLPADGALGKRTFATLTTPFAKRVEQIELTLERWRWLPPPQAPMIVVNVPQFKLFAFQSANDNESNLLRMDVIVGQAFPHTQTPVFLADMKYVVFRPYWDVPLSIIRREILPNIHNKANYLARNHFELVRGQGDNSPVVAATPENIAQLASGAMRVRQQPGDDNALGEVKFMLPNSYNVYLHSTPAKRLFSESSRAFSHGCIRVSDPTALAEYVLRNTTDMWDKEKIKAALHGDPNQRVYLNKTIPVMIVYGTAMPLESGVVQFFEDIYGHDAKLAKLL